MEENIIKEYERINFAYTEYNNKINNKIFLRNISFIMVFLSLIMLVTYTFYDPLKFIVDNIFLNYNILEGTVQDIFIYLILLFYFFIFLSDYMVDRIKKNIGLSDNEKISVSPIEYIKNITINLQLIIPFIFTIIIDII